MTFLFCRRYFCCFSTGEKQPASISPVRRKVLRAPNIWACVCERACQSGFNMLHITLCIFADSVMWGDGRVHRAEDQANVCVLFKQPSTGQGVNQD